MALTAEDKIAVCAEARSYLGTRWRSQGRDHNGIDCIGIVVMSLRARVEIDEGTPDYRIIDPIRMVETLHRYCDKVDWLRQPLEVCDIVVWEVLNRETHCGLIVDGRKFPLHIIQCPMGGVAVETRFDMNIGKIRSVWRWRS